MASPLQEARFHYREEAVACPELDGWGYFPEGEPAVWTVRQVTTAEIYRAASAPDRAEKLSTLLSAISYGNLESGQQMLEAVGLGEEDVPAEVRKKIALLCIASVSPPVGDENRLKIVELSTTHPATFIKLSNVIDRLTSMGAELGKSPPSGKIP
jgi:hypothetical protein